jgi:hypothetical protein
VAASQTIDLERERSVGQILSVALSVYRRYPLLFATLAVGVIAPYELARLAVTGAGPLSSGGNGNAGTSFLFQVLDFSLVGPLVSALHVHAVVEIGDGKRPRLASVAMRGLRVLPVVAAAEIIANILIGVGFLALVVPGVILALRFSVVAQTAAIDHEGWQPALGRSRRLTAGHYWHIIGLLVVTAAVTVPIGIGAAAASSGEGTSVGAVVVGILVHTITASFAALTLAILYFDLRAREARPVLSPGAARQSDLD